MTSINLDDFSEEAAYQVHAVLETLSQLGEQVEVYDGERLVGMFLRGETLPEEDTPVPGAERGRHSGGSPSLGIDITIEESIEQHQQLIDQFDGKQTSRTEQSA